MSRIKLQDVAREAGVSLTAASFAINGKPGVSEETRRAVVAAMDALGYRPKTDESKKGKNRRFGKSVLLLNCSRTEITRNVFPKTQYFSELLGAFEEKLSETGYHFWVKSITIDEDFEKKVERLFAEEDVTSVLLIATDMLEEDVRLVLRQVPQTVVLDASYDCMEANCVVMDNYLGGVLAARHALERGHTHIGYLQAKTRIYNFEMRKRGFFEELARHGVEVEERDMIFSATTEEESAQTIQEKLKDLAPLPTCFFAENDYLALGMLRALKRRQIEVPGRVAVIGFDNIDMARAVTPGLTTINVPKLKIAEFCISQIKRGLRSEPMIGVKQFVAVDLVCRETT